MAGTDAWMTRWAAADAARCLRRPTAADDKYSRGVVGLRTGSDAYPGAAVLGVQAAWRTGVGMVRYLGPAGATALVLARRPETVTADGRVQAWVIGSGTDAAARTAGEAAVLAGILAGDMPVVADAGALDLVIGAAAPLVVTPHAGEHARLRALLGLGPAADRAASARSTAAALGAAVLLKGAETVIATPAGWSAVVDAGPPWLATAGTGDVLAGVLGALVAGRWAQRPGTVEDLGPVAATAAWLHGRAAVLAAAQAGHGQAGGAQIGGPITALDVADALPRAVAAILAG
ncbi:hypothetical protein GCM10022240_20280 [Microbacterium kribbense]|uniref:ADP-dependent (S)-NAD(P)H-hydrate dehydratase n=1 Tax=Microbacterium kribbense TaxID=433645 RepID=A0ABP7GL39_9MICO